MCLQQNLECGNLQISLESFLHVFSQSHNASRQVTGMPNILRQSDKKYLTAKIIKATTIMTIIVRLLFDLDIYTYSGKYFYLKATPHIISSTTHIY